MKTTPEDTDVKNNSHELWSQRRKMAWTFAVSVIVLMSILLFPIVDPARVAVLENIIVSFFWLAAAVIGSYMGFKAFAKEHNK